MSATAHNDNTTQKEAPTHPNQPTSHSFSKTNAIQTTPFYMHHKHHPVFITIPTSTLG